MKKCHACHQTLPAGARFCAYCGTELIAETFLCPHCQTENELDAAFCTGCGTAFQGQAPQSPPSLDELEHAIAQAFVMAFRERIESELDPKRYDEYVDRFYGSEFREGFEARVRQLAQDWQARHPTLPPKPETAAERLALTFDGMLDHFFITQCQDMAEVALPTAILNYESGRPPSNLGRMVLDYLDLENEPEPTYFNLVAMPLEKLKNATRSFFFPEKG
ncbi:MAG: zinc-ribbon domain-containing protein, partial [Bacteroidetes bacterium]